MVHWFLRRDGPGGVSNLNGVAGISEELAPSELVHSAVETYHY